MGNGSKDVEYELACRRCCVDAFFKADQPDVFGFQTFDGFQQLFERPPKSVQSCNGEAVTGTGMFQKGCQSWPVELLTGDDIFENADGTCLLQLCDLSRQTLVLCGDARVSATRMGMVSSAVTVTKAINNLRPRVLAVTGICAGHKSKVNLGDVLAADPAWDFQSGKMVSVKGKTKMEFSPHQIPLSAFLRSRFEQIAKDRQLVSDITSEFGSDAPSGFKLRIGPVASGGAVLADGGIIDDIRQLQNRDLLGIEMEIYGAYAAAQQAGFPQPKVLALKGVCD